MKKKLKIIGITIAATLLVLFICTIILTLTAPYRAVIKKTEGNYYNARHVVLAGSSVICRQSRTIHKSRKSAFSAGEEKYSLSVIPIAEIISIEFIIEEEDEPVAVNIPSKYLGTYTVNVSGHKGYLYLAVKNGRLHGGFRFPRWAKGVYEPLKRLRIHNGKISFIRSVTSAKELRRVGANTYFTQHFYGKFKNEGKLIEGSYMHRGVKNPWQAFKK